MSFYNNGAPDKNIKGSRYKRDKHGYFIPQTARALICFNLRSHSSRSCWVPSVAALPWHRDWRHREELSPCSRASAVEGDDHQRTSARSTRSFSGGGAGFSNTRPPPPGLKTSTRLSGASWPTGLWFYICLLTYTHTARPVHRDHRLLLCCSREPHVPGRLGRGQARHSCD